MHSMPKQGVNDVGFGCGVLYRDFGKLTAVRGSQRPAIEAQPMPKEALAKALFAHVHWIVSS